MATMAAARCPAELLYIASSLRYREPNMKVRQVDAVPIPAEKNLLEKVEAIQEDTLWRDPATAPRISYEILWNGRPDATTTQRVTTIIAGCLAVLLGVAIFSWGWWWGGLFFIFVGGRAVLRRLRPPKPWTPSNYDPKR
jgi:hypothetical protein